MYKYSVIIPHYRDLEALDKLLSSIPPREDIQVILVDDHSFDDPKVIFDAVEKYKRDGFSVMISTAEKNGAGLCRNQGLKLAEGKWLLCADSDDYYTDTAFQSLDKYYDDEADIVYFTPTSIELPSGEKGIRHIPAEKKIKAFMEDKNEMSEATLRYEMYGPVSKMIRRSMVVSNHLQFSRRMCANDVMFSVCSGYYAKTIKASSDVIYVITRKQGSLTMRKDPYGYKERFDAYVCVYTFLRDRIDKDIFEQLMGWTMGKLIRAAVQGYGYPMVSYMYRTYKRYRVPMNGLSMRYLKNSLGFISNSFNV